jgi:hypothetical protein
VEFIGDGAPLLSEQIEHRVLKLLVLFHLGAQLAGFLLPTLLQPRLHLP